MVIRRLSLACLGLCCLALVGCREEKMASYRVRKEAPAHEDSGIPGAEAGAVPQLHWKAPEDWKEEPAGNVRVASFSIVAANGKADVSITQFPGEVGGDLANVNRWRGQLQLAPISEADIPRFVKAVDLPAGSFSVTEFVAEKPVNGKLNGMLGAWLKQPERAWFFKLSGDQDVVIAQREAFVNFLKTIEIATPAASMENASAPNDTAGPNAISGVSNVSVTWTAPTSWTTKPLGQMRKGSYTVHGVDGADADLSIISFPGEAGGLAQNLNRWRKQLQLPEQSPADLASAASTVANDGLRFTVVDYAGTAEHGPTRLLGAILPLENETYFFKLIGPDAVVTQHKEAFLDFLKTVKVH